MTPARLRLYADFNSSMEDHRGEWCWLLRFEGKRLDEVATELGLYDGMPVTLYWEDPGEKWEMDGVLGHIAAPGWEHMWMAQADVSSYRLLWQKSETDE